MEPTHQALEGLLQRLRHGDEDAAAAIYTQYAPFLKMVVRRKLNQDLQTRFDPSDVVQSVWADLLQGFQKTPGTIPVACAGFCNSLRRR